MFLPGSQITVDKVQRFQVTHSRRYLCGEIQQTLETENHVHKRELLEKRLSWVLFYYSQCARFISRR